MTEQQKNATTTINDQQKTGEKKTQPPLTTPTTTTTTNAPSSSSLPFLNQTNLNINEKAPSNTLPLVKPLKSTKIKIIKLKQRLHLAKLYLSLGHFYLLIYDYAKALSSYQKFLTFKINKLKVTKTIFVSKLCFKYVKKSLIYLL